MVAVGVRRFGVTVARRMDEGVTERQEQQGKAQQRDHRPVPRPIHQSLTTRSRSALAITETELSDIAAAAITGLKSQPNAG